MRKAPNWTQAEDDRVRELLGKGLTQVVIAERLGRGRGAVNMRAAHLGLTAGGARVRTKWSRAEDDRLKEMLEKGIRQALISQSLGRSPSAVNHRAKLLKSQRRVPAESVRVKASPQLFSADEDAIIARMAAGDNCADLIGEALGRDSNTIRHRAKRLGVTLARKPYGVAVERILAPAEADQKFTEAMSGRTFTDAKPKEYGQFRHMPPPTTIPGRGRSSMADLG